jgi:hypothetical protein
MVYIGAFNAVSKKIFFEHLQKRGFTAASDAGKNFDKILISQGYQSVHVTVPCDAAHIYRTDLIVFRVFILYFKKILKSKVFILYFKKYKPPEIPDLNAHYLPKFKSEEHIDRCVTDITPSALSSDRSKLGKEIERIETVCADYAHIFDSFDEAFFCVYL